MSAKGASYRVLRMSDQTQANKRGGKRRPSVFTQRAVQRALRAAKAEQENRIVRMNKDGSIELVPMTGEGHAGAESIFDVEAERLRKAKGR
jgi:hypothetical protein